MRTLFDDIVDVICQYVSQTPVTHLYGWKTAKLPEWFTKTFVGDYRRKRLFE
jgi:hypothetical protein